MTADGPRGERGRILFISSNGTGLGHLTRSMAIARRLEGLEPLFFTLSAAAPVVREQGFPVEYAASYSTPGAGSDWRWSRRLRGRLRAALSELRPRVVVFDGAHPYQALIDALPAAAGAWRVWSRRPLWKPGANPGALDREGFFDRVLEPGELAAQLDRGATVARRDRAHVVDPIVFCDDEDLPAREEAARELGLDPAATCVLVNLGQGEAVRELAARSIGHLSGRPGVQVAVLSSAIAAGLEVPDDVVHLRATYPISRCFAAFDAAVAAAGYNAYHELIRFGVPSLYVPMRRQTDDQAARALFAEREGLGLGVESSDPDVPVEAKLDSLLDDAQREAIRARLHERRPENGAADAAAWVADLAASERPSRPATSRWRKYLRDPAGSARRAAPFVARLPLHAGALVKQTIQRRPPRTVIVAFGVPSDGMAEALGEALSRTPDPPERVLVVTDSLELAPLRRLGVGFEHVPARGEAQPEAAGGDYEAFARRRLELILAERPRPRRLLGAGEMSPEKLASFATLSR